MMVDKLLVERVASAIYAQWPGSVYAPWVDHRKGLKQEQARGLARRALRLDKTYWAAIDGYGEVLLALPLGEDGNDGEVERSEVNDFINDLMLHSKPGVVVHLRRLYMEAL
jgi:hypothetical protein